jgi:hypothetical protein
MNTRSLFRRTLLAACALMLGACQMTTFEAAPLAAGPCDPALAGQWLSQDEDPAKNGEVVLRVDASCQLVVDSSGKDGVRSSESTALHLGQHGLYRYAWVDARWAMTQFDEDHPATEGDVYLLRIARDGDRLTLWTTDDKAVAHAIIDGDISGEVVSRDRDLFNRLTGNEAPAVLDHPALFNADPVQFVRAPQAKP